MTLKRIWFTAMALVLTLAIVPRPAFGNLILSGEFAFFMGPSLYELDILATADGSDYVVNGTNFALDFTQTGVQAEGPGYEPNPELELAAPVVQLDATLPIWGIGGTDTSFPVPDGVEISDGQTVSLGTISFEASSPGEVPFAAFATFVFEGNNAIPATLGQGPTLSVVPEPTSTFALLACSGLLSSLRRRR